MTPASAKRIVAANFPEFASLLLSPVANQGHHNRTFRLGSGLLVWMPKHAAHAGRVKVEFEWLGKLAPHVTVPIPVPVALGELAEGYAWHWLVNRWVPGTALSQVRNVDSTRLAEALAEFLTALHAIDTQGAPGPGRENFYRDGEFSVYAGEAFALCRQHLRGRAAKTVESALRQAVDAPSFASRVWVHGDFAAGNLLVKKGALCGVIDFGQLAAGDPACDLAVACTGLGVLEAVA